MGHKAISLFFHVFINHLFYFVWPNSLSLALQVIFKPRLVRAEWGSIEAMSGADDEDTAGGRVWTRFGWDRWDVGFVWNSRWRIWSVFFVFFFLNLLILISGSPRLSSYLQNFELGWMLSKSHAYKPILMMKMSFWELFEISRAGAVQNCLAHRLYQSSNADKHRVLNGAHGSVGHYPTAFGCFGVGIWPSKDDTNLNPHLKDLVLQWSRQQTVYGDFPTFKGHSRITPPLKPIILLPSKRGFSHMQVMPKKRLQLLPWPPLVRWDGGAKSLGSFQSWLTPFAVQGRPAEDGGSDGEGSSSAGDQVHLLTIEIHVSEWFFPVVLAAQAWFRHQTGVF